MALGSGSMADFTGQGRTGVGGSWGTLDPEEKKKQIAALYQQYLGRDPDPSGLSGYLTAPNLSYVETALKNSKEYAQRQAAPTTTAAATTPTTTTPAGTSARGMGWGGGNTTLGFDYTDTGLRAGPYMADLRGFNTNDKVWNAGHQDYGAMKNIFARAAAQVDPHSANATQQVVDILRGWGVDASVENPTGAADRIKFGATGESVDVRQNAYGAGAYSGDTGWQWIDSSYENGSAFTPTVATVADLVSPDRTESTRQDAPGQPVSTTQPVTPSAATSSAQAPTTTLTDAEHSRFLDQYVKPFFESRGVKVLEVVGGQMHVLTPEDQAAGRTEGQWISVGFDPMSGLAGAGA